MEVEGWITKRKELKELWKLRFDITKIEHSFNTWNCGNFVFLAQRQINLDHLCSISCQRLKTIK